MRLNCIQGSCHSNVSLFLSESLSKERRCAVSLVHPSPRFPRLFNESGIQATRPLTEHVVRRNTNVVWFLLVKLGRLRTELREVTRSLKVVKEQLQVSFVLLFDGYRKSGALHEKNVLLTLTEDLAAVLVSQTNNRQGGSRTNVRSRAQPPQVCQPAGGRSNFFTTVVPSPLPHLPCFHFKPFARSHTRNAYTGRLPARDVQRAHRDRRD